MALLLINRLVACAGLALLLAGCCANNVCDCPNEAQADAIRIVFDRSKFTTDDLDTLALVRYLHYDMKNRPAILPKPETAIIVRTAAQLAVNDTLIINNATPFTQLGSARLDTFSYVLRYYPGTKPRVRAGKRLLVIERVKLSGSFEGDGCCTCYSNSRKLVQVWPDSVPTPTFTDLKSRKAVLPVTK
ncbi:hypothetical protein MON38_01785 [Hymenobacter sp. DH14]|uniref:Uncharacterized protein n=1 Tax=Hymenobacter cyanobacteriorum TaxID=2926463 RepID=A0A9X1VCM3_9BACT|nr:hypothetical protein [Hymenobacter cyanobacteriorum]MCI1186133.1 hypothetical protein [Hymenobacter cyanobacteriorum]